MIFFEHKHEALLPLPAFIARVMRNGVFAAVIILVMLLLGVAGYHWLGPMPWLDALVNASMILGGMGPVDTIHTVAGKWFESLYALFAGVAFLTSVGVFFAPLLHRFLHRFHLEEEG